MSLLRLRRHRKYHDADDAEQPPRRRAEHYAKFRALFHNRPATLRNIDAYIWQYAKYNADDSANSVYFDVAIS